MSVYCTILNSPHKSHQEGQQIELVDPKKSQSHKSHYEYYENIDNCNITWTSAIDNLSDYEATHDFTKAKNNHGDDRAFQFVFRDRVSDHGYQATRIVSYADASPEQVRH